MPRSAWKSRTTLLLGESGIKMLHQARVLVAGLGGVGAQAAEQLCRAGLGHSYMPAVSGCYCASVVIRDLLKKV